MPTEGSDPTPAEQRRTILVLDDSASIRYVMERVLRSQGLEVLGAADAHEALELLTTHPGPIHLIVCDLVLPGLGGREAANALLARRPEAKVLFVSGYSTRDSFPGGLDEGLPFISKPFDIADLMAAVNRLLDDG